MSLPNHLEFIVCHPAWQVWKYLQAHLLCSQPSALWFWGHHLLGFVVPVLQFSGIKDKFSLTGSIFGSVSIVVAFVAVFVGWAGSSTAPLSFQEPKPWRCLQTWMFVMCVWRSRFPKAAESSTSPRHLSSNVIFCNPTKPSSFSRLPVLAPCNCSKFSLISTSGCVSP